MNTIYYSLGEGIRSLRISPLQTFFSILGIIIGVASLVAILALGDGLEKYARDQISSTTSLQNLEMSSVSRLSKGGVSYKNPDFPIITYQDKKEVEALFDSTVQLSYYFNHATQFSKLSDTASVVGFLSSVENASQKKFTWLSGGLIEEQLENPSDKVWISSSLLEQLKSVQADTSTLMLFGKKRLIEGVFQEEKASRAVVHVSQIPDSLLSIDPPSIQLRVSSIEQVNRVKANLYAWAHTRYAEKSKFIKVNTYEGRLEQTERAIMLFKLIMGLITGISVLVGGIGVMNVLLMSIKERTPEIGIKKAVGAKRNHIVIQFLAESVMISTIGSFIGLLFSVIFMEIAIPVIKAVTEVSFPLAWTLSTLITVCTLAIVVGIIFGTYPAYKASRLAPIEAIQRV